MYCDFPLLGRCCFCMPLRKGILTFGYINLIFTILMVGLYSYSIHADFGLIPMYHGAGIDIPAEVCLTLYCIEFVFNGILIYGAHMKIMSYIKAFYYFTLMTIVTLFIIQIIEISEAMSGKLRFYVLFEIGPFMFASLCIQIYLLVVVRSLLRKMEISSSPNVYDNPLQQFVYDGKVEANGVYDSTVVPVEV